MLFRPKQGTAKRRSEIDHQGRLLWLVDETTGWLGFYPLLAEICILRHNMFPFAGLFTHPDRLPVTHPTDSPNDDRPRHNFGCGQPTVPTAKQTPACLPGTAAMDSEERRPNPRKPECCLSVWTDGWMDGCRYYSITELLINSRYVLIHKPVLLWYCTSTLLL